MKPEAISGPVDRLLILLPDQLNESYRREARLDRTVDAVLQMELADDFGPQRSHKQRTALFLSAMRHFGRELQSDGWRLIYTRVDDPANDGVFGTQLERVCRRVRPKALIAFTPGDRRTLAALEEGAATARLPLELLEDPLFLVTPSQFDTWAVQPGRRGVRRLTSGDRSPSGRRARSHEPGEAGARIG